MYLNLIVDYFSLPMLSIITLFYNKSLIVFVHVIITFTFIIVTNST